jgi:hypothetical protein
MAERVRGADARARADHEGEREHAQRPDEDHPVHDHQHDVDHGLKNSTSWRPRAGAMRIVAKPNRIANSTSGSISPRPPP